MFFINGVCMNKELVSLGILVSTLWAGEYSQAMDVSVLQPVAVHRYTPEPRDPAQARPLLLFNARPDRVALKKIQALEAPRPAVAQSAAQGRLNRLIGQVQPRIQSLL